STAHARRFAPMTELPPSIPDQLDRESNRSRRSNSRRSFPREFRREVVSLVVDGHADAASISAALGVEAKTIERWIREDAQPARRQNTLVRQAGWHLTFGIRCGYNGAHADKSDA